MFLFCREAGLFCGYCVLSEAAHRACLRVAAQVAHIMNCWWIVHRIPVRHKRFTRHGERRVHFDILETFSRGVALARFVARVD